MKRLVELSNEEAKKHFLKESSYFNGDFPSYLSFEPILNDVESVLNGGNYAEFKSESPNNFPNVNYNFVANKDGRFAWRPYELIHPVIYVSLVNVITEPNHWDLIPKRFAESEGGAVECSSGPRRSTENDTDVATRTTSWWATGEQRSLKHCLQFSQIRRPDERACYGSLYTHSIAWAVRGLQNANHALNKKSLLGNMIDA